MSENFPTFERLTRYLFSMIEQGNQTLRLLSPVLTTPWWPADRLSSKQRGLLRILKVAAIERMEAAPLVASFAAEHRWRFRRRVRLLAKRLEAGATLADALEQTPGVVSDHQQLAIRFGEQSGTLPAVLGELLAREDTTSKQADMRLRQIGFYSAITLTVFVLVLSFILIKIIPSFQAILHDFSMQAPYSLIWLIRVSNFVSQFWFLFALLIAVGVWLIRSQRSRRFFRRKLWSRLLPPVAQLRSADLMNLLSVSLRAGRPLAGALSTLARYHYDTLIRHKLLFVRNEIEQGANVWESMATARLLSPQESHALDCSTSSETRAWSMNQLAKLRRGYVSGRLELFTMILQVVVILMLAAAVLLVALACLSPLVEMVSGMS